jgi:hypothetical protein
MIPTMSEQCQSTYSYKLPREKNLNTMGRLMETTAVARTDCSTYPDQTNSAMVLRF